MITLTVKYALFACIATLVNIGSQFGVLSLYSGPLDLYAAMGTGTATGLVTKYYLDKNYIFRFIPRSVSHDIFTFMLYTVMGLFTTAIFWGTELVFHRLIPGDSSKYFGAATGLVTGYTIKYFLDRAYVFTAGRHSS